MQIDIDKRGVVVHHVATAGLMSCCSVRFVGITQYCERYSAWPEYVNCYDNFTRYTTDGDSLVNKLFALPETSTHPPPLAAMPFSVNTQYAPYSALPIPAYLPILSRYFSPGTAVIDFISTHRDLDPSVCDYSKMCAVYYRGTDKRTEAHMGSYREFIRKAAEVRRHYPKVEFLVQTDELLFYQAFKRSFPSRVWYAPILPMFSRSIKVDQVGTEKREDHAVALLGTLIILGKCHTLITNSSNCGLWLYLLRQGNGPVYQRSPLRNRNPEPSATIWW